MLAEAGTVEVPAKPAHHFSNYLRSDFGVQKNEVLLMASKRYSKVSKRTLGKIESILAVISSNIDFDLFHGVMGLVYIETHGTVAGFELLNEWANSCGVEDVPTGEALWDCWCMYDDDKERYFGMARLLTLAKASKKKKR